CFFNDTATTEIYSLSLHDALPISQGSGIRHGALQPGVSCILLAQARHNLNVESGAVVVFGDGEQVATGGVNSLLREVARRLDHAPAFQPRGHREKVAGPFRTILNQRGAKRGSRLRSLAL